MKKQIAKYLIAMLLGGLLFGGISAYAGITTIKAQIGGIKLFIGGALKQPESQPILYNGRTYVPLRFVAETLGETVEWDNATKSVFVGGRPEGSYLTDVIVPHYKDGFITINGKTTLGNDTYYKTIKVQVAWIGTRSVSFDLKNKFSRITLKIGAIDENNTVKIWGDGNVLWEGNLKPGNLPKELDLNVQGVNNLKFEVFSNFVILDPKIYP